MSTPPNRPTRRRVPLPATERFPRVGKIRLGERVAHSSGRLIPQSRLYFVVHEDTVTPREAAAAFHEVYGENPIEIRIMLPGERADDVLEGAWRVYAGGGEEGGGSLERKCDGVNCDRRTATGAWENGVPCVCLADEIPAEIPNPRKRGETMPNPARCVLGWTLNVILPDVRGVGVWQIDTRSEITISNLVASLAMLEDLQGSLLKTEATLRVVPTTVKPGGRRKTVPTLQLVNATITPRQAIAGMAELEAGRGRAELPPPPQDDERDPLIHPEQEAVEAAETAGEASSESSADDASEPTLTPAQALTAHVNRDLDDAGRARVVADAEVLELRATGKAITAWFDHTYPGGPAAPAAVLTSLHSAAEHRRDEIVGEVLGQIGASEQAEAFADAIAGFGATVQVPAIRAEFGEAALKADALLAAVLERVANQRQDDYDSIPEDSTLAQDEADRYTRIQGELGALLDRARGGAQLFPTGSSATTDPEV